MSNHLTCPVNLDFSKLPVSKITGKPVIHFAHANGMPSRVYQPIFELLEQHFTVEYIPTLGFDEQGQSTYPIDNHWKSLTQQVIDSVKAVSKKHKVPVIGLGHSLGALCTLQALYKKPKLFLQVVLMDPPLIYGRDNLFWHLAKWFSPKHVDQISPAGISKNRRDVWDSREQARELLGPKRFFKNFDPRTFEGYIQHGMRSLPDGRVTLTIPKQAEVAVFRTNPSWYWLKPNKPPKEPATLLIGDHSQFYQRGFPPKVRKRLSIPFKLHPGGHMFPLEYPDSVAQLIMTTIMEQIQS
ncbi:alpha/beta fold hydrolase [Psychrobacter sp. FDAARGOS_221]|uniref:alpha/beta fold hydrolase n=1 Tax=Psychrobacter sp. FDAARGOS_221 TaxID=1975705 RepID=UPI000BB53AC9|nr:alpha/beta hydrolase [Psychrobacter sp. FDAARGOS_221]PNK61428.1 alpha/beta hydrolase [Psychrobacter sp. FDAARGOS_221]